MTPNKILFRQVLYCFRLIVIRRPARDHSVEESFVNIQQGWDFEVVAIAEQLFCSCVMIDCIRSGDRLRGSCYYLSTNFCPSSVKKKISDFWDLNPGPKSRLRSSCHYTTASLRRHKYYIPTYLQARCVSCRVSLAATHTTMPPLIFAPTK